MILRRYGNTVQSVELDFDPHALSEVGFRRDRELSMDAEEFERSHEKVEEHELSATADSSVQDEGETALLEDLESQVRALEDGLDEDAVLLVENTTDDYPKTRDVKKEVIVEGKNRLHFSWRVDPPLRMGIYRRTE